MIDKLRFWTDLKPGAKLYIVILSKSIGPTVGLNRHKKAKKLTYMKKNGVFLWLVPRPEGSFRGQASYTEVFESQEAQKVSKIAKHAPKQF